MEFRILGPLEIVGEHGPVTLHRGKEQALLIFYFSGHAKSNALDLGDKELDITVLRDRLKAMPTTLTLVVPLDRQRWKLG